MEVDALQRLQKKANGEKPELLVKRDNWVAYLHEREAESKLSRMNSGKNYTKDFIEEYISTHTFTNRAHLEARIVTTLKNPDRQQDITSGC